MMADNKRYRVSVEVEVFAPTHGEAMEMGLDIVDPGHYHQACVRDINGGELHGDIVNIFRPEYNYRPVEAFPS